MVAVKRVVDHPGVAIPNAQIGPAAGGIAGVDFMFTRDDEIRGERDAVAEHAFQRVVE